MKITTTFGEIIDKGNWDAFCDINGINQYCIKEGLADRDTKQELSIEEAQQIGLIKERKEA